MHSKISIAFFYIFAILLITAICALFITLNKNKDEGVFYDVTGIAFDDLVYAAPINLSQNTIPTCYTACTDGYGPAASLYDDDIIARYTEQYMSLYNNGYFTTVTYQKTDIPDSETYEIDASYAIYNNAGLLTATISRLITDKNRNIMAISCSGNSLNFYEIK